MPSKLGSRAGGRRAPEENGSSIAKALAVLGVIGESDGGTARLSDIASLVDVPKSTAHRLLKELEAHEFVTRSGVRYRVGNRLLQLSDAARWSEYGMIRTAAVGEMERLVERTQCTAHLAVRDGDSIRYIEKVIGRQGHRIPTRVGGRAPVTCTALGKVLLAFDRRDIPEVLMGVRIARATPYSIREPARLARQIADIRQSGVARDVEEARNGLHCVAAPVTVNGTTSLALSLSAGRKVLSFSTDLAEAAASVAARVSTLSLADGGCHPAGALRPSRCR